MDRGELEFVNRERELAFLSRCLKEPPAPGALVVLRAPSGFGKSRLVDRMLADPSWSGRKVFTVDPGVRAGAGAARLHGGFFLQRCADALDEAARLGHADWLSLQDFLKQRRWKTAAERPKEELLKELPTVENLYKLAFGYATRLLGIGEHSAKNLLQSDEAAAVLICTDYVRRTLDERPVILVLRESQHIDLESLEAILALEAPVDLLFEYTSENGQFLPEHHKAFLRAAEARGTLAILDLVKLELPHLERLLRDTIREDLSLETNAYLSWDGNLRSVVELRFRVGIGVARAAGPSISGVLAHVSRSVGEHIQQLSSLERLVLAIVVAHVEAVEPLTVIGALSRIDPATRPGLVQEAIVQLIHNHRFLSRTDGLLCLHDETVAAATTEAPGLHGLVALAEDTLRDHYRDLISIGDYSTTGMSRAVRQIFRLCARTRDASGLMQAVATLSERVAQSQDQLVYVEAVAEAISADPELYQSESDDLLVWAATLAYGVSDWARAVQLVSAKRSQDGFSELLQACALPEIGRHEESLELARRVAERADTVEQVLAARLVEALVLGCLGEYADARQRLELLVADPIHQTSPLLGYAYRFFEVVDGFVEALPHLLQSAAWFDRFGFRVSKAYSQLPAAMYLARLGDVVGARLFLAEAEAELAARVRDQHLLFNNRAAVELLADDGGAAGCVPLLKSALRSARDDYSETTILTNLALAHWQSGDLPAAVGCAQRAMDALADHDFADKDTYWPVCFNVAQVFMAAGEIIRAQEALAFPRTYGRPPSVNRSYWAFRYGEVAEVDEVYAFLVSRPFHPLYLSHWTIDLEGLELLKTAPSK